MALNSLSEYQNPGAAFGQGFEDYLMQQAQAKRQAEMDQARIEQEKSLAVYRQQEIEQGKQALERQREEADERIKDKRQAGFERRVHDMLPGDIPDASMLKMDDELGTGYFPVNPDTGVRTYLGNRQDREAAATKKKVDGLIDQLQKVQPGTPEYIRLATQYEMTTGKTLPAAMMKGPAGTTGDTEAVIRTDPRRNIAQRLVNGQWVDVTGDVPKGSHWLQEPQPKDHSLADANRTDRVQKQVYDEIDKKLQPITDRMKATTEAMDVLDQRTGFADTVAAPVVLKALVVAGGRSASVRMTQSEINSVAQKSGTNWEALKQKLMLWNPKDQSVKFTDAERKAMGDLVKKINQKDADVMNKVQDIKDKITEEDDPKKIRRYRDEIDKLMNASATVPEDKPKQIRYDSQGNVVDPNKAKD